MARRTAERTGADGRSLTALGATTLCVEPVELAELNAGERAWVIADELRWRRAHEIADRAGVDVGGVYRVLRNLEKTPTQSLASALRHGRLFRVHAR